jgi:hypothetical protein
MDIIETKTDLKALRLQLKELRREVRALNRFEKALRRREAQRRLAVGLREGYSEAGKRMLAKRAAKASARGQKELGWPNLRRAWAARRLK